MSEIEITENLNQLQVLLSKMKTEKQVKPLRKRIARKYEKLHNHYLSLIEDVNQQTEIMKIAFEIIILETKTILELSNVNSENEFLKKQVKEQRTANKKVYHLFKRLTQIMKIAIE